jgi:hypothetical protein
MSFPYGSAAPPAGQVSGGDNALPIEYMFSQIMGAVQKSVSIHVRHFKQQPLMYRYIAS